MVQSLAVVVPLSDKRAAYMVQFVFPKLKADSVVTHRFEVIKDSSDAMVIGRDLISALGLILNFKGKVVQWDECSLVLNTGRNDTTSATDEEVEARRWKAKTSQMSRRRWPTLRFNLSSS